MTKQSELLTRFYNDWHRWRIEGAKEHPVFNGQTSLCLFIPDWLKFHNVDRDHWSPMDLEMEEQFRAAGLDECFPFNEGNQERWISEREIGKCHLNPRRIMWVQEKLNG